MRWSAFSIFLGTSLLGSAAWVLAIGTACAIELPVKKVRPGDYIGACGMGGSASFILPGEENCPRPETYAIGLIAMPSGFRNSFRLTGEKIPTSVGLPSCSAPKPETPSTDSAARREDIQSVETAQARLAFRLIEQLAASGGDAQVAVSPAGLASVLALAVEGASPPMRDAIVATLGFNGQNVEKATASLRQARRSLADRQSEVFQSADKMIFERGVEPNKATNARLRAAGIAYSVDDLTQQTTIDRINQWVRDVTRGKIAQILDGPVDQPAFVIVNALYFADCWQSKFEEQATRPAPFRRIDGRTEDVAMMTLSEGQRFFRFNHDFVAIEVPFINDRFSLVVVTTTQTPARLADFKSVADWLTGEGYKSIEGDLKLPRFSVEAGGEMLPALDALGLLAARSASDSFSGFSSRAFLSDVLQRTKIEVNEGGARTASATAIVAGVVASIRIEGPPSLHMVVDKPFLFAFRDRLSGLLLAAGYVGSAPRTAER